MLWNELLFHSLSFPLSNTHYKMQQILHRSRSFIIFELSLRLSVVINRVILSKSSSVNASSSTNSEENKMFSFCTNSDSIVKSSLDSGFPISSLLPSLSLPRKSNAFTQCKIGEIDRINAFPLFEPIFITLPSIPSYYSQTECPNAGGSPRSSSSPPCPPPP